MEYMYSYRNNYTTLDIRVKLTFLPNEKKSTKAIFD